MPEQQSRDGRPGFYFTLFQQTPLRLKPLGPQGDKRLLLRGPSVQNPSLQQRAPPGAASCLPRGAEPGPPQAAAPRRAPAPCARGVRRRFPARASGGRQRASRQAGAEAAPHLCPTPAARPRLASRLAPLPSPSPRRPSQLGGGSAPERASTSLPPSLLPSFPPGCAAAGRPGWALREGRREGGEGARCRGGEGREGRGGAAGRAGLSAVVVPLPAPPLPSRGCWRIMSVCARPAAPGRQGWAAGSHGVPACLCAPPLAPAPRRSLHPAGGEPPSCLPPSLPPSPPGRAPLRDPPGEPGRAREAAASCDSAARCQQPGGKAGGRQGGREAGSGAAPPRTHTAHTHTEPEPRRLQPPAPPPSAPTAPSAPPAQRKCVCVGGGRQPPGKFPRAAVGMGGLRGAPRTCPDPAGTPPPPPSRCGVRGLFGEGGTSSGPGGCSRVGSGFGKVPAELQVKPGGGGAPQNHIIRPPPSWQGSR